MPLAGSNISGIAIPNFSNVLCTVEKQCINWKPAFEF
jgi:hypothetical protein